MNKYIYGYSFTVLKTESAKAQNFINNYNKALKSNKKFLSDFYKYPSETKMQVYNFWKNFYYCINGFCFYVVSANCNTFVIAFMANYGETRYLFYITRYNNYIIEY